jgi:hypothetical protein
MNNFSRLKALDAQNVPITVEDRLKYNKKFTYLKHAYFKVQGNVMENNLYYTYFGYLTFKKNINLANSEQNLPRLAWGASLRKNRYCKYHFTVIVKACVL